MKSVLLLIFAVACIVAQGQKTIPENSGLAVQKIFGTQVIRKEFIPGKTLQVKTLSGETFQTVYYEVLDDKIVLFGGAPGSLSDTLSFSSIGSVKGKVRPDGQRKVLGGVLLTAGLVTLPVTAFLGAWSSNVTAVVYAMPSATVAVTGVTMLGRRNFKTKNNWQMIDSNP